MVNRSISNKSFLGVLCLSASPSNPVSAFRILSSSSSSGVVRNVSESLLGIVGAVASAVSVGWATSDASDNPAFSAVGSVWKKEDVLGRNKKNTQTIKQQRGRRVNLGVMQWGRVCSGGLGSWPGWRRQREEDRRVFPPCWLPWRTCKTSRGERCCWAPSEWSSCSQRRVQNESVKHKVSSRSTVKMLRSVFTPSKTAAHTWKIESPGSAPSWSLLWWAEKYADILLHVLQTLITHGFIRAEKDGWPAELRGEGWSPSFWTLSRCSLCKPVDVFNTLLLKASPLLYCFTEHTTPMEQLCQN